MEVISRWMENKKVQETQTLLALPCRLCQVWGLCLADWLYLAFWTSSKSGELLSLALF